MSTETMTREERRAALDEFAQATSAPSVSGDLLPAVVNATAPAIIGAQVIAGGRRDVRQVLVEIKELAAAAGPDWYYRFPVKNRKTDTTDWIEGPSIKLAMAVMGIVGNIEVDTRVQDFGTTFMIYARAIDLEKGSAVTRAFQQSKSAARIGGADEGRRNDMALQIGQSKAIRNAICALLETYTDFAFDEAKNAIVDKIGRNLVQWRERTVQKLGARIDIKRVEAVLGRTADQWLAPDVARVIAMGKAVEDGMASMDETFPPLAKPADDAGTQLDSFADRQMSDPTAGETAAPAPPEDPPPAEAGAAQIDYRPEIATKIIELATDKKQSVQERLEALEFYRDSMVEGMPEIADFIRTACATAARVAKEEMPAAAAKKYLQGLVK